jgi:hypothetical protein
VASPFQWIGETFSLKERWCLVAVFAVAGLVWWYSGFGGIVHPRHVAGLESLIAGVQLGDPVMKGGIRLESLTQSPLFVLLCSSLKQGYQNEGLLRILENLSLLQAVAFGLAGAGFMRVCFRVQMAPSWLTVSGLALFMLNGSVLQTLGRPAPEVYFWAASLWATSSILALDADSLAKRWWSSLVLCVGTALLHPLGWLWVLAHVGLNQRAGQLKDNAKRYGITVGLVFLLLLGMILSSASWQTLETSATQGLFGLQHSLVKSPAALFKSLPIKESFRDLGALLSGRDALTDSTGMMMAAGGILGSLLGALQQASVVIGKIGKGLGGFLAGMAFLGFLQGIYSDTVRLRFSVLLLPVLLAALMIPGLWLWLTPLLVILLLIGLTVVARAFHRLSLPVLKVGMSALMALGLVGVLNAGVRLYVAHQEAKRMFLGSAASAFPAVSEEAMPDKSLLTLFQWMRATDPNSVFLSVNPAYYQLYGYRMIDAYPATAGAAYLHKALVDRAAQLAQERKAPLYLIDEHGQAFSRDTLRDTIAQSPAHYQQAWESAHLQLTVWRVLP